VLVHTRGFMRGGGEGMSRVVFLKWCKRRQTSDEALLLDAMRIASVGRNRGAPPHVTRRSASAPARTSSSPMEVSRVPDITNGPLAPLMPSANLRRAGSRSRPEAMPDGKRKEHHSPPETKPGEFIPPQEIIFRQRAEIITEPAG